jgi:hypothetical protein
MVFPCIGDVPASTAAKKKVTFGRRPRRGPPLAHGPKAEHFPRILRYDNTGSAKRRLTPRAILWIVSVGLMDAGRATRNWDDQSSKFAERGMLTLIVGQNDNFESQPIHPISRWKSKCVWPCMDAWPRLSLASFSLTLGRKRNECQAPWMTTRMLPLASPRTERPESNYNKATFT